MPDLAALLQQGTVNLWLFIPSAILLGALHGLEPGHSKTMMAAFIVAIRGTVGQAVMLGLAATVSHTAVVWAVALVGLHLGSQSHFAANEPYFQIASAILIIAIALWMIWRTARQQRAADHAEDHGHGHGHDHNDEHEDHAVQGIVASAQHDAHELAHANDIRRRFTNRAVTNGQILLFGLTGGLIPCPASITVLLLCLQLKKVTLGVVLVLSFSVGLALTLVFSGVVAAIGMRHATKRWAGVSELAQRAPYLSGALILLVGLYVGYQGLNAIQS